VSDGQLKTERLFWQKVGRADDQASDTAYRMATLTNFADYSAKPTQAVELPTTANGVRLRFLLLDTEDFTASCKIWLWGTNGAPYHLATLTMTAGAIATAVDPTDTDTALIGFYADTITIDADNTRNNALRATDGTADQVNELSGIDLKGDSWILVDWKTDGGAGTTATDAIALLGFY